MELIDIFETFNYTTNINWKGNIGEFIVGEQTFIVEVRKADDNERKTFVPFFDKIPKVGNVTFSAILDSGEETQDLTNTSGRNSLKVFSVVAQAVSEQIEKYGFEILLCIAKKDNNPTNYENRVQAYNTIVNRIARKYMLHSRKMYETSQETVYVVFPYRYNSNIDNIVQHLDKYKTS